MRAVVVFVVALSATAPAAEKVDYLREIKPLLAARCFTCHAALKQQAKLRLDTVTSMRQGGESGPAIVPGKSADSPLIARVTEKDESQRMPPESEGQRLTPEQIAKLRAWIDQGAAGPADEKPETDPREHWAFRPIARPVPPSIRNPQFAIRNSIDAFVAAEHARRGLSPQPPADRRTLLRRVYLDLVGLPPTREELAAFLADDSPNAYERVVERLLASPLYGERWGRHWMDISRYSDWWGLGAEVRNSQKHIWHWRDWIIESLNDDAGYDEMLRQMLAADELYPTDLARLRATGFLVRQYFIFNRTTWLDETIEHTSKAFLGLTFNCTKCHDHKYDPISQVDYYRLRAFFEPYQVRTDQAPGEVDYAKDGIPRVFDCNLEAATHLHIRGDDRRPQKDKPLTPGLPAIFEPLLGELKVQPVALPPEAHQPGLRPHILQNHLAAAEQQIAAARTAVQQAHKALVETESAAQKTSVAAASGLAPKPKPPVRSEKPLVEDDFASPRSDLWEQRDGKWKYEGGRLLQQQDGDTRTALRAKASPPDDFEARFRFAISGGQMWKSVGLSFDVAGEHEVLVYLSAYAGGPKLQIAYKQGASYVYPPETTQAREVKLGQPQDLHVRVRGPLLNVSVNGRHALAWRLPIARKPGRIELITYDAQAAFTGFALSRLSPDVALVEPTASASSAAAKAMTLEQARAAVVVAERALAAAEAQPAALKARAAADRARSEKKQAVHVTELARAALKAERQAAAAKAAEELARAELEVLKADAAKRPELEKKTATAKAALEAARKAIDTPGESYTPLAGSLKAPESNLETEASRMKPHPVQSTGRRAALARWITHPRHPLTARVAVNHLWARHFGQPLAPTVFDFGRKGTPPTNPPLVDWLATELIESGWSMKHLHRLMVTSSTYRLSTSTAGAANQNLAADPENKFVWRMNPVRIEAQVVRDALLHLSGELDLTAGGPSIPLALEETSKRRSLYFVHSHNEHSRFLSTFDDASVLECYRRSESIVPQQALALSNSKLGLATAEKIGKRLDSQAELSRDVAFVAAAYETILADTPSPDEQAACQQALTEFRKLYAKQPAVDAARRARVNLIHALLNHNDFVTRR